MYKAVIFNLFRFFISIQIRFTRYTHEIYFTGTLHVDSKRRIFNKNEAQNYKIGDLDLSISKIMSSKRMKIAISVNLDR